ncbi:MAG: TlpA disulfide reductase family protein [Saprospiraceae bacterium]|jgi:thiol-disulfide isomerase/thioredoxin
MRFPYSVAYLACFFVFTIPARVAAQGDQFAVYDSFAQLEERIDDGAERILVINFWATWCKPCIEELPYFEALHCQYASKKLGVLLVSLDFKSQKEKRLRPFLQENGLCSEVVLLADQNADYWIPKMHADWDGAIPITIVINRKRKKIGFHHDQFKNYDDLVEFIRSYM